MKFGNHHFFVDITRYFGAKIKCFDTGWISQV